MLFHDSIFPKSDPSDLLRSRDSIYASDLLITAITKLDLFNRLAARPSDLDDICGGLGTARRPTDVMLTLFIAMGLLNRDGGRYLLTDKCREFLSSESRWDLSPYFASLQERPICRDILQVLRDDRPLLIGTTKTWRV